MKNGRADHDDEDPDRDPKIARIEDARRRRQLGLGDAKGGGGGAKSKGRPSMPSSGGVKELLIGVVIVAMALGFVVWMARPLWQGAVSGAP
jgi:hypothetical protein